MHWPDHEDICKRSCTDEAIQCPHRSIQNNPPGSPPIMFSGLNRRRAAHGHPLPSSPVRHFAVVRHLLFLIPHFSLNGIGYYPPTPFAQRSGPVRFPVQAQCIG